MRHWPFAALQYVIQFPVRICPLILVVACGSGATPEDNIIEAEDIVASPVGDTPSAAVPTSDLFVINALVEKDQPESEYSEIVDAAVINNSQPLSEFSRVDRAAAITETSAASTESSSTVSSSTLDVQELIDLTGQESSNSNNTSSLQVNSVIEQESETAQMPVITPSAESTPQIAAAVQTETTQMTEPESETESAPQPEPANESTRENEAAPDLEPVQYFSIGSGVGDVVKLIDNLQTSSSQTNVQQTPLAVAEGYLYTANIEHGPRGDVSGYDLKTVVRQGKQGADGLWNWRSTVVEDRTVHNKWHTAPSIQVDKEGLVHVVYNHHNFPWQYKRTTAPHDLNTFEFLGQTMSDEEIRLSAEENRTSFPTLGMADIPGNQITYPAFFKDRNDDLYLSYRFAATPKQSFENRTMSSGVSVYNSITQSWTAIGGTLTLDSSDYEYHSEASSQAVAIAAKRGWTSYHPRLVFDQQNRMYINWFWRNGTAGALLTHPCLISTADRSAFSDSSGNVISLPVEPDNCGNLGYSDSSEFYSIGNTTINNSGEVHMILSPDSGARQIVFYDNVSGEWRREDSPYNASEIFFDSNDTLWAIARGIKIYKRALGSSTWETVYDDSSEENCYPKATTTENNKYAFIHAEKCGIGGSITLFGLRLE